MNYDITPLEWESNFFGYPIAKISITETNPLSDITENQIKNSPFILTFVHCDQFQLPKTQQLINPSFIEKKVIFESKISKDFINEDVSLSKVSDYNNLNEIYYLALEAGKYSRFRLDKNMKNFEFEKLYFEWIFKSIPGNFDHDVFVYFQNNSPVGLLTLKVNGLKAQIGLISSHISYQGKGIGSQMIQFAKNYAAIKNCSYLSVATQESNHAAMSFYHKNGFSVKNIECILHSWK